MEILVAPHEMLRTICRPDFVIRPEQIVQMFQLMQENHGVGLAAPQVGLGYRFFVTAWGQIFFNPEIATHSDHRTDVVEGCLSLPGEQHRVWRWNWIQLKSGQHFDGFKAQVIQHELDHLNGRLISDK